MSNPKRLQTLRDLGTTLIEREAFDSALISVHSVLETRGGWARVYGAWAPWIELALALAAIAISQFLGGLLHGA